MLRGALIHIRLHPVGPIVTAVAVNVAVNHGLELLEPKTERSRRVVVHGHVLEQRQREVARGMDAVLGG
jgi:hypothetical protein